MILTVLLFMVLFPGPGSTASQENIAVGAKAVQSSTYNKLADAEHAVDGNSESNYMRGSCTHTNPEDDPWLRVELPGVYNITSVTITNRGDCCENRINGAQIRIGNSLRNNGNDNKLVAVIGSMRHDVTKTYRFKPIEGRYVNIFLPGEDKILSLCEVQVFADEEVDPALLNLHENLAIGGKTVQSSTYDSLGQAANAVDGNSNTDYLKRSCTHTKYETNPWWRVELPEVYNVTSVTVVNRGDCCVDRINGAQIRIGNSLKNNGNNNKLVAVIGSMGFDVTKTYKFKATEGRFVNIFLPGQRKILTLCEVEVFADEEFESFYLHDKEDMNNIALRGTATQSSLHSSGISAGFSLAINAIDGNRNSDLMKGSCMRTEQEQSPWWRLSLNRRYIILSVALTNRGDCCSEHLDGAEIRIGDSLENDGKDNPLCATVSSIPAGQTEQYDCSSLLEGSYVTIFLPGEERTLSLCEVEVFGLPVAHCVVSL